MICYMSDQILLYKKIKILEKYYCIILTVFLMKSKNYILLWLYCVSSVLLWHSPQTVYKDGW